MPVSPQDFELYSRMTGAPMPSDAMSRMQMAPDVYKFTKNYAKKPNFLERVGNLTKNLGKTAVMVVGAPMVAESMSKFDRKQEKKTKKEKDEPIGLQIEKERTKRAVIQGQDKKELAQMSINAAKAREVGANLINATVESVQEPTSADSYGQDRIENQTGSNILARSSILGSQIANTSTPTQSEVLSESQDSTPADFKSELIGDSGDTAKKVTAFLSQKNLEPVLLAAMSKRGQSEPLEGYKGFLPSPLNDHPDLPGGEDDDDLPSGMNTGATTNLKSFYKEMRKMDSQERIKSKSQSNKKINLLEQRAIDNKAALDTGFMNLDDEGRAKETSRLGGDRIREMAKKSPDAISATDIKRTGLLSGQLTRFPAGEETRKAEERKRLRRERNAKMSPSTSEKVDDFTAKFVEGSRSDIVRGKRGNQSLGITRIPATNGDAQVGFVLANKPLDQSPTKATTYGYGVAPGAESLLDNQLNQDSFSDYMNRGRSEAREGKKRKAGEIFEFLPKSRRVVQGTASLGDIVM